MDRRYRVAHIAEADRAKIAKNEPGSPIPFILSSPGTKRDGLDVPASAWDLTAFKANPVVPWVHDYQGNRPPIGRAENIRFEGDNLVADIVLDMNDEFARLIDSKVRNGFVNAASVGFDIHEFETDEKGNMTRRAKRVELLDASLVPVPGDPSALSQLQRTAYATVARQLLDLADDAPDPITPPEHSREQKRAAIPPHSTAKADENASWDGPGEVAKADATEAKLRSMHAWVNAEADPDAKSAYKLPHHTAEGEVVWRGVAAAMARLLQAGTQIPDADRRGVHRHLSRHYAQFDKTPPEFRSNDELAAYSPAEVRGLFLEGEPDLFPDFFAFAEQRAGQVLSARNRDRIESAISALQEVLQSAQKEPAQQDEPSDEERAAAALAALAGMWDGAAA